MARGDCQQEFLQSPSSGLGVVAAGQRPDLAGLPRQFPEGRAPGPGVVDGCHLGQGDCPNPTLAQQCPYAGPKRPEHLHG